MESLLGILWLVLAVLTTRRVFRIAIPRAMPYPTMGNYLIAWVLIFIWWNALAYSLLLLFSLILT